ncbi:hypothetical protein Tco_0348757 [Tanacetum coccineum]
MGDVIINTLTMEQEFELTRENQALGVVKPEIGGNVNFEIMSQFMRELREDTFSGKNDDAYEHVERILDIVSLFNILGVTHDAVMLRVFPITLTEAAKSSVGIASITNKLDSLGRDMKNLKENVHAIQVGYENYEGAHLNKECPLHEELAKDYKAKAANEVLDPLVSQCKAIFANNEAPTDEASSKGTTKLQGISFIFDDNVQVPEEMKESLQGVLPCQLPPKELKLGSFTLPCTIGDPNETMILGRPFVATIHARIDVFDKEISLGVRDDRIVFDMNGNVHHPVILVENVYLISDVQGEESFKPLEIGNDLFLYEPTLCLEFKNHNNLCLTKQNNEHTFVSSNIQEDHEREKGMTKMAEPKTTTPRLHYCRRLQVLSDGEFDFWPSYDPTIKACNEGDIIYRLDEHGALKHHKNYSFKEWLKVKIEHTNVEKYVKSAMLNEWILDSFDVEADFAGIRNDPYSRSLDEYKAMFDNEIGKLANEYELRIGKKGYVLDDIWEKCKQVHGGTLYSWHDDGLKEEERWEVVLTKNITTHLKCVLKHLR